MCLYCKKLLTNLPRHFMDKHKDEDEVKSFSALPKGNLERKKILDLLRKKGNFLYNTNCEVNKGDLIISRRPSSKLKRSAKDFIACVKCYGFFSKNNIRHHFKKCLAKESASNTRTIKILGRSITCQIHHSANFTLKRIVFPVMREDDVTRRIRYDELLIAYGNKMCTKYRLHHQHDMIRARMRLLGRFLIELSEIDNNIIDFTSVYHPGRYDNAIIAVHQLAEYDEDSCTYKTPSIASTLGTLLKLVGHILRSMCIKKQDEIKQKEVENFLKLLEEDYGISVNKTVKETMIRRNRQKNVVLPSMEDIKQFNTYLKTERRNAYDNLKTNEFSMSSWLSLAEYTLTSIQSFNGRRAGELERILIEDLNNKQSYTEQSDSDRSLSKYARIYIRGKLGRNVPLLLNEELLKCIDMILKYRGAAGVPNKNPYIFGLPSLDKRRYKYLRACVLMRKFSLSSGVKFPTLIRGTNIRKHIATMCITLDISENQISELANFMGHHEKVHKSHYRQSILSREIAVSRLLAFAQGKSDNDSENDNSGSREENEDVSNDERKISVVGNNVNSNEGDLKINLKKNIDLSKNKINECKTVMQSKNKNRKKYKVTFNKCNNDDNDEEGSLAGQIIQKSKKKVVTRMKCTVSNASFKQNTKQFNLRKRKRECFPSSSDENDFEEILSECENQKNYGTHTKKRIARIRWTDEEKDTVLQFFQKYIERQKLPSFTEINNFKTKYPILKHRTVAQLKTWIHNQFRKFK
ncbi:uncharacterized protein [Prorops nasuta]|uniref:uncharacterized protein n=1 Tax=Prorops nasuta TaxID=863751 RepID=UPI0034CED1FD